MKTIFILLALVITSSCNKWCKPENIRSGKSSQHHDSKKMKVRVMWVKQYGSTCVVRYENMKTMFNRIYTNCDCKKFKVGTWINIDSI